MWCDVGRGRLAVDVAGPVDGVPVLLVAGGGGASWGWGRLVRELAGPDSARLQPLADALPRCRVAAFDQAGVGRSVDVPPAMTAERYAMDAALVGHAALGERFIVVGISLGGAAALQLALAEPATVAGLVLGCTFAGMSSFVDHELEPLRSFEPAAFDLAGELADEGLRTAPSFGARFLEQHPELFAEIVRRSAEQPTADGLDDSQVAQFVSHDVTDRLGALSVPVAVVCGDQDRTMPLGNSRLLAERIPGASLDVLGGVGHAIHMEAPDALAGAIRRVAEPLGP